MDKAARRRRRSGNRQAGGLRKLLRYGLAAAAVLLALQGFFRISDVQISGNVVYSSEDVAAAAGVKTGGQILLTRCGEIARRIEDCLPAVEEARVSLSLPGTVTIQVREGQAVAALPLEGRLLLLSCACKVVGEGGDGAGLIQLRGLSPAEAQVGRQLELGEEESGKLRYLAELLPLLQERELIQDVGELDLSNAAALRFTYAGRFTIRLGSQERLPDKLDFLERILAELSHGETGVIDLATASEGHLIPE